ncbi:MAG: YraN family protein [Bacteroidaceae bacterium]|nr:YraN family protein [Bacteroidaceae bacterium]
MTKGFTILLIEEEHSVYNSNRYLLIGKYLSKQDIKVNHILENGTCYSQESIDEIIVRRENEILAQKNKAADLGQTGEELAALHLMRKGYMILDHNWNLHKGCELDLIARKDGILHFVEVKTRSSDKRGAPQQAIDLHKIHNIQKAIKEYMSRNDYFDMPYQVDSIAIIYHSEEDYSLDMQEDIKFQTTHNN